MTDYLSVPEPRRERLIHEKARHARRGELSWIRSYITDIIDDEALAGQPPAVRLFAIAFEHLAARTGWIVLRDEPRLAAMLHLRIRDVRQAVDWLIANDRIELVYEAERTPSGAVQTRLDLHPERNGSAAVVPPQRLGSASTVPPQRLHVASVVAAALAQPSQTDDPAASERLASRARTRAEQRRTTDLPSISKNVGEDEPLQLRSDQTPENLRRLVGLVSRGNPSSAGVILYAAEGLPEVAIASTIESYLGRRPRPSNPIGYVVGTLNKLRAEYGLPDRRARIEREPDL